MNAYCNLAIFFCLITFSMAQIVPSPADGGDAKASSGSVEHPSAEIKKIDIDFVTVGDPGNKSILKKKGEMRCRIGSVDQVYKIGRSKVTVEQYCAFLNAVAVTHDSYQLYHEEMSDLIKRTVSEDGTYAYILKNDQVANKPIVNLSWLNAARFCNWLHHDQLSGPEGPMTTERGAYTLDGAMVLTNFGDQYCQADPEAKFFLPTEDQLVKAIYYKGGDVDAGYWKKPERQVVVSNKAIQGENLFSDDETVPTYGAYGISDIDKDIFEWTATPLLRGAPEYHTMFFYLISGSMLGDSKEEACDEHREDIGFRVAAPASSYESLITSPNT